MEAKANIAQQPWVIFGCFAGAPGAEPSLESQDGAETWEAKAEVHVGDPDGDPVEPSPGTARPPPATDGTGKGLPMSPHRSFRKSKAETSKRRAETPAP